MKIQPYELSIWQDYIDDNGQTQEHKLAVIACDYTSSPIDAYNISLQENINGEKTLKFSMAIKYLDSEDNQFKDNPFIALMIAERKIKLFLGSIDYLIQVTDEGDQFDGDPTINVLSNADDNEERWTEFLIKKVDKDSANFVMTFECKESYVTELGKNGWAVILDNKKKNNYGTAKDLGNRILENSDWIMDEHTSIKEGNAQALFRANILGADKSYEIYSVLDNTIKKTLTSASGYFYFFYSDLKFSPATETGKQGTWQLKDPMTKEIQILYLDGKDIKTSRDFILDDDGTVIDDAFKYNFFAPKELFTDIEQSTVPGVDSVLVTPKGFSGRKLINSTRTTVEPVADKYVEIYKNKSNEEVYSYLDTTYSTSKILKNYIANSKDFTSAAGWTLREDKNHNFLFKTINNYTDNADILQCYFKNVFLVKKIKDETEWSEWNYNRGPYANDIPLIPNKKFVIRFRGRMMFYDKDYTDSKTYTSPFARKIEFCLVKSEKDGNYTAISDTASFSDFPANIYYGGSATWDKRGYPYVAPGTTRENNPVDNKIYVDEKGYYFMTFNLKADVNMNNNELVYLGVRGSVDNTDRCWCIDEMQLFEFVQYHNDAGETCLLFPEDTPVANVIPNRVFYTINAQNEIQYLDSDESLYEPIKNNYESVRCLSVSQNNYFNSITSLSELFQGWASFHIAHYRDGRIKKDENNKPIKTILISPFHLHDDMNWGGFKYDVNLKTIKRTVDSNATVSKLIVKNNNNEHAKDGICSILRANDNPLGSNIIYNFDYYITQGLINERDFNAWYYGNELVDNGWLPKIGALNKQLYEEQQKLAAETTRYKDAKQKFEEYSQSIDDLEKNLAQYRDNYEYAKKTFTLNKDYAIKYKYQYFSALASIQNYENNCKTYKEQYEEIFRRITEIYEPAIKELQNKIKALEDEMYSRNSRFLQEGTWTDDSYIDDTLYYYDACKVSNQSAYPKLSYTMDVADITDNNFYAFQVGERTYVEDPDFFGYDKVDVKSGAVTITTIDVPHKKEVVVQEYVHHLDDPSKNTITIKTYKNEFRDLFSKLTSSVQSLQYQSGGYNRASEIVQPNGEVSIKALEKSLTNNAFNISSAGANDMTFSSDEGLVVKDIETASNIVRTTSKGIIMSNDGGLTWQTAISADGINTNQLTAGYINAGEINILGGDGNNSFVWNESGLSAYCDGYDAADRAYVRFNKYGIYGINKISQKNTVNIEITDANFDSSKDVTTTTHIDMDSPAIELKNPVYNYTSTGRITLSGNLESAFDNNSIGYFSIDKGKKLITKIPVNAEDILNGSIVTVYSYPSGLDMGQFSLKYNGIKTHGYTENEMNYIIRSREYEADGVATTGSYAYLLQVIESNCPSLPVGTWWGPDGAVGDGIKYNAYITQVTLLFLITSELIANLSFECNTSFANNCSAKMSITHVDIQSTPSLYEEVPIWSQNQILSKASFTDIPFTEEQLITTISKVISTGSILSIGRTTWYDLDDNVITNYDSYGITDDKIELSDVSFTERLKIFAHNFKPYVELSMAGSATTNIALEFDGIESSAIDSWTVTQDGNELSSTTTLDYSDHVPTNLNSLPEIMANSSFALTWKGLRFNDNNGRALLFADAETGDLSVNKITAKEGSIAGWTINENYLSHGGIVGSENSMYLSPVGVNGDISFGGVTIAKNWTIAVGTNFFVSADGTLYAKNANIEGDITANAITIGDIFTARPDSSEPSGAYVKIANFRVDHNSIYYYPTESSTYGQEDTVMMCSGSKGSTSIAGSPKLNGWTFTSGSGFGVTNKGALYANSGMIGNWIMNEQGFYSFSSDNTKGIGLWHYGVHTTAGHDGICIHAGAGSDNIGGAPFRVYNDGTVVATSATISGTISAASFNTISAPSSGASFCGWTMTNALFGKEESHRIIGFDIDQVGKDSRVFAIGGNGSDTTLSGSWADCAFYVTGKGHVVAKSIEFGNSYDHVESGGYYLSTISAGGESGENPYILMESMVYSDSSHTIPYNGTYTFLYPTQVKVVTYNLGVRSEKTGSWSSFIQYKP